jgi:hypothetical protein
MKSQLLSQLHRALLGAFTSDEFDELLATRLGVRADLLSPPGDMSARVFDVLQTAERAGWTTDLVRAAYEARPNHDDLSAIHRELGLDTLISVQHAGAPAAETSDARDARDEQRLSKPFLHIGLWRERLAAIESWVCRMEVGGDRSEKDMATGFLVGPDAIMTCHHVVADVVAGRRSPAAVRARFDYRMLTSGSTEGLVVRLHPTDWLIDATPPSPSEISQKEGRLPSPDELDHAVLRLARPIGREPLDPSAPSGPQRGWLRIPDAGPMIVRGMGLMIVHYPLGNPLQITIDTDAVTEVNKNRTRVRYTTNTVPGSGGAPCFNTEFELVAMHHRAVVDRSSRGYGEGIPVAAIRDRLVRVEKKRALGGEAPIGDKGRGGDARPPDPGLVKHLDDPQKDRFGGAAERKGRKLSVNLKDIGRTTFLFDVVASSTDGSLLEPPVIFHLHDSYAREKISIRRIRDDGSAVLEDVDSYGVYTIGAQVKDAAGNWTSLEFDLATLDLPSRFLSR